jgi:phosphopantothenoylcysteine decarboxylase/phosphopantothenate--cysteine ligase
VLTELFEEASWANHVALGRWADVFLVAPLSCNTLAKMASGLCDNLLMATFLSATCPVVIAPAMDEDMWHHPATKKNLQHLADYGCSIIPVVHGELASGLVGEGRMAEPEALEGFLSNFFGGRKALSGKKVLVTAGPTYEALDPVRFIGNHSSGKMGYAIAAELVQRGATVVLVSGPVSLQPPQGVAVVPVTNAQEMYDACFSHTDYDIAIMAAAVADYTPVEVATQKLKKGSETLQLALRRTPDILASLGKQKRSSQVLVGFALETENEIENAQKKLLAKGADLMVLNSLQDPGAGFGKDTNKVKIFFRDGREKDFEAKSKGLVARDIIDIITEVLP